MDELHRRTFSEGGLCSPTCGTNFHLDERGGSLYWVSGFGYSNLKLEVFQELGPLKEDSLQLFVEDCKALLALSLELELELE